MKYKKHILLNLLLGLFLLAPLSVTAATSQPIAAKAVTVLTTKSSQTYIDNYYSTVNLNLTGEALKAALETRLLSERGRYFTYSNMQYDAFPYTDVDPLRPNGGYIVSFYSGTPVYGYTGMNKEHTWPNSHGGRMIENDPHMVRPTLIQENSTRGNEYYAQAPNIGWDPAELGNEKYRGMSARVALYGAVIGHSKGLILEDVGRGEGTGTGNRMGKLGDLLKWNLQYPVDISEIIRNETLDISLNYNRNPFIDDPSLACKIFSETTENTQSICSAQAVAPTSLSISPNSFNLNMGSTQALTVASVPTNATRTVTWTSSNNNIAMVNNGIVTPIAVGTATITATSTLNSAVKTTANVTVTNIPIAVTGISLDKEQVTLGLDITSQLSATVAPSNASNQNVGWTSSNNNIATVSNNGLISAIALGNAVITATTVDGGFSDSVSVSVIEIAEPEQDETYTFTNNGNDNWPTTSGFGAYYGSGYGVETAGYLKSNKVVDGFPLGSVFTLSIAAVTNHAGNSSLITVYGLDSLGARIAGVSGTTNTPANSSSALNSQQIFARANEKIVVLPVSLTKKITAFEVNFASSGSKTLLVDISVLYTVGTSLMQAQAFAGFVNTDAGLNANGKCVTTLSLLDTEYSHLSTNARALFLSEEGTSFVNARARIAYMESWVTEESAINRIETIIDRNNNLYAVVLVATLALSSILGYYFICKRKTKA